MSSRHRVIILAWSLLLGLASPVRAQGQWSCQVEGRASSYAGKVLRLCSPREYISLAEEVLDVDTVAGDGRFVFRFSLHETRMVTLDLEGILARMYVSPGDHLQIGLPPLRPKTEADRVNPFFQPMEVQLRVLGGDTASVNSRIGEFDLAFDRIASDALEKMSNRDSTADFQRGFDEILALQRDWYPDFVNAYIRYRAGLYGYITRTWRTRRLGEEFFLGQPLRHHNPAYMDLFNLVYNRYFLIHGRTDDGVEIFDAISRHRSYSKLLAVLDTKNFLGTGDLRELVVLKNLYEEFFSNNFSRTALQAILDSVYQRTTLAEHVEIANVIRNKITRLLPGFIPNSFHLLDVDGRVRTLRDFTEGLILLDFCSLSSYSSLEDFAFLSQLKQAYGARLHVVLICADSEYGDVVNFARGRGYDFTFLHYGREPDVLRDWDVRAYPTYYLLDEHGRMLRSPAPRPSEGLGRIVWEEVNRRGWLPARAPERPRAYGTSRYVRGSAIETTN